MPVAMLAAAFHDALEKRRLVGAKRRKEVGSGCRSRRDGAWERWLNGWEPWGKGARIWPGTRVVPHLSGEGC